MWCITCRGSLTLPGSCFWHHMISSDVIWYQMISCDIRCDEVWTRSAALWLADTMVYVWYNMISVSYDISWHNMTSCDVSHAEEALRYQDRVIGIIWYHLISYNIRWYHMTSVVTKYEHEALHCDWPTQLCTYDIIWYQCHMISADITWHHVMRHMQLPVSLPVSCYWHHMTLCYIIWCQIMSYDSYCDEVWTRSVALWSADRIVHLWYNMIWYDIIRYHMIHFMGRRGQLPCQAMINIWKLTSSYDVIWHHMISYDVLFF